MIDEQRLREAIIKEVLWQWPDATNTDMGWEICKPGDAVNGDISLDVEAIVDAIVPVLMEMAK
jgi:hypothetical protein